MSIGERIKTVRGSLSQKDFAKKIGVHLTTVQLYESGNIPKGDVLQRIKEKFGVSIDWLLTGEGEPFIDGQGLEPGSGGPADYCFVPLVEGRVTAGSEGGLLYDEPVDLYPFKKKWILRKFGRDQGRHKALVLVRVTGDSMVPTINPGELILMDTWEIERLQIKDGKVYLVRMPDGTITVKRLILSKEDGNFRLICLSDNPNFEPFKFLVERPLQWYVLGRIRWVGREID